MHLQGPSIRIERRKRAERQRPLVLDVANRNPEKRGYAERMGHFFNDRVQRALAVFGRIGAVRELPHRQGATARKRPRQLQLH